MSKLTIYFIVVTGLFLSCNNSQTTTNEQTSGKEENINTIQEEESTSLIETESNEIIEKKNSKNNAEKKQIEENEQTISWAGFYKQFEKKAQTFSINSNKDTLLTCLEGTTIRIRPNSFISEKTEKSISGVVKITVTEYYKLSDILLANLTTTSDNLLLETGGMIHITAVSDNENCKIKDGQKIEIGFPAKSKKEGMQLFTGEWNENRVNWQAASNSTDLNKIFEKVDVQPQFPGGDKKMMEYLNNIKYPEKAKEQNIQGVVRVNFTIDREGNVRDAVVVKGIHPACDREVLKSVLKFPKFKPAQIKGENVNANYSLSYRFRLDNETTKDTVFKEKFEKSYNDSIINTSHSSYITSYLFSTSELGWINCDRFINEKEEKIDCIVKLDKKAESDVKIVFHRIKSIMPSFPTNDKHIFNKIPKGEKITIVAIKNIDNKPHLAIKETVTSAQTETDFTFEPITLEKLKNEMKKLDKLNL